LELVLSTTLELIIIGQVLSNIVEQRDTYWYPYIPVNLQQWLREPFSNLGQRRQSRLFIGIIAQGFGNSKIPEISDIIEIR